MLPNLFQQDGAPAHRSRHTVAYLRSKVPEFIEPENWPPNSPDLNPVDYAVWGALQQMVYRRKISDIDQLKRVLIDCWAQLSQDTLNRAIDQLPKRLMRCQGARGSHRVYYVHKLDAQRMLMPYVAGYGPSRARPIGPLQRFRSSLYLPVIVKKKPQPSAKREIQGRD